MFGALTDRTNERGDTIIEVLVALAAFGVVVVGAFSLMNHGVAQMYDSMEKSEVRMLLNSQTEVLTYMRDEYLKYLKSLTDSSQQYDATAADKWRLNIKSASTSISSTPSLNSCDSNRAFWVIDASGQNIGFTTTSITATATTFPSPGNGIWVQKILGSGGSQPYVDFYIRACWRQNSSAQTQVLSTVVRLYDK